MPDRIETIEVLRQISGTFARLQRAWYLFGAQAVVIWGRPRMTADIDVTIAVEPAESASLVAAMGAAGFSLRIAGNVDEFVARTRVLPFVHDHSRIPVDVVLAGPGIEQEFLARAEPVDLGGLTVPVLCAEDLVVTKILAGRPKDLDDVAGVLRERGEHFQLDRVRSVLRLIEQALDQSDLLPELERQVARARA